MMLRLAILVSKVDKNTHALMKARLSFELPFRLNS